MSVDDVMAELEKDVAFYDESGGGVTFSGGEPLRQPLFLLALLESCKARGIHTALETSGFAPWPTVREISMHTDLFLYDLKVMDDEKHRALTGVSNASILRNLKALASEGSPINVRVPIIPGVNDDEENLRQIAACAASLVPAPAVVILPYHGGGVEKYERLRRIYRLSGTNPPSEERIAEVRDMFVELGLSVTTGG
jgi:pyruvate formate lyase activating enzyme